MISAFTIFTRYKMNIGFCDSSVLLKRVRNEGSTDDQISIFPIFLQVLLISIQVNQFKMCYFGSDAAKNMKKTKICQQNFVLFSILTTKLSFSHQISVLAALYY